MPIKTESFKINKLDSNSLKQWLKEKGKKAYKWTKEEGLPRSLESLRNFYENYETIVGSSGTTYRYIKTYSIDISLGLKKTDNYINWKNTIINHFKDMPFISKTLDSGVYKTKVSTIDKGTVEFINLIYFEFTGTLKYNANTYLPSHNLHYTDVLEEIKAKERESSETVWGRINREEQKGKELKEENQPSREPKPSLYREAPIKIYLSFNINYEKDHLKLYLLIDYGKKEVIDLHKDFLLRIKEFVTKRAKNQLVHLLENRIVRKQSLSLSSQVDAISPIDPSHSTISKMESRIENLEGELKDKLSSLIQHIRLESNHQYRSKILDTIQYYINNKKE